jgi:hypothetical protein
MERESVTCRRFFISCGDGVVKTGSLNVFAGADFNLSCGNPLFRVLLGS